MSYLEWFLRALVLVPVTLLPIINPLSTAPVFVATVGTNRSVAKRLARQVAIKVAAKAKDFSSKFPSIRISKDT